MSRGSERSEMGRVVRMRAAWSESTETSGRFPPKYAPLAGVERAGLAPDHLAHFVGGRRASLCRLDLNPIATHPKSRSPAGHDSSKEGATKEAGGHFVFKTHRIRRPLLPRCPPLVCHVRLTRLTHPLLTVFLQRHSYSGPTGVLGRPRPPRRSMLCADTRSGGGPDRGQIPRGQPQ